MYAVNSLKHGWMEDVKLFTADEDIVGFGASVSLHGERLMVGATFQPEMLHVLKKIALPVVISCVVLVGAGVIMAIIFTRLGLLDMGTAYIGTSPGAMSALIVLALDSGAQPMLVVCFHFVRVVLILLTAPLIFKWLSG